MLVTTKRGATMRGQKITQRQKDISRLLRRKKNLPPLKSEKAGILSPKK